MIPAYNEAATVAEVAAASACQPGVAEVIAVDDGSRDATAARLAELAAAENLSLTVLRHPLNRGKAASLITGMTYALDRGADAVITLDGDGQHRPDDIPQLLNVAIRHPGRLVIAARLHGRGRVPKARRFANWMADFWISWAAGYPVRDSQSGFRLYPAALLRQLRVPAGPGRGFVFESEFLIAAGWAGSYPVTLPVDAIYHHQARPSHYRPALDTARIVRMVAGRLLRRGLYPPGLLRALGWLAVKPGADQGDFKSVGSRRTH